MAQVVIIGAGKTGRGLIGRLCLCGGHAVTFIDKDAELVRALNIQKRYVVSFFGDRRPACTLDGYRTFAPDEAQAAKAIAEADFVITSVAEQNLKDLLPLFESTLSMRRDRKQMRVITAENGLDARKILTVRFETGQLCVGQAMILCTTVEDQSPLSIRSEDMDCVPYDWKAIGSRFPCEGFQAQERLQDLLEIKLYTYNCLNACISYLGELSGYTTLAEAAADAYIAGRARKLKGVIDDALSLEYGITPLDQASFSRKALEKFENKEIIDPIARNVRDVQRKLSPNERMIAPLRMFRKYNMHCVALLETIAAALHYGLRTGAFECGHRKIRDAKSVLSTICGLDDTKIIADIIHIFTNI